MKKRIVGSALIVLGIIVVFVLVHFVRIWTAEVKVVLDDNLKLEFNDKRKVSSFIKSINGEIIDDYYINSDKLGKKEVEFKFKNDDGVKVKYSFFVEVVDTVKPIIWVDGSYDVLKGSKIKLEDKILCGDNYDSNPRCTITGNYDLNKKGKYPLTFTATDSSGNTTVKNFTLNVYEKSKSSSSGESAEISYTSFKEFIKKYKNDNTEIGIDVSFWQGDIDFERLKSSGVEFIFIRVGGTDDEEEYFLDSKFKRNIEGANKYGIKAGIYYYSYANSVEQAKKEALWVIDKIKDYKIDLPVVFDWEEWGDFNTYNLSFYGLSKVAEAYLDVLKDHGYKGMLYSSMNYLERIWYDTGYDVWLAHYTDKTSYKGDYKYWQLSDTGKIDGIKGPVDVNIYYK